MKRSFKPKQNEHDWQLRFDCIALMTNLLLIVDGYTGVHLPIFFDIIYLFVKMKSSKKTTSTSAVPAAKS